MLKTNRNKTIISPSQIYFAMAIVIIQSNGLFIIMYSFVKSYIICFNEYNLSTKNLSCIMDL